MKIGLYILPAIFLFIFCNHSYGQAGNLDSTFGTNGVGAFPFKNGVAYSVAIQSDGKIVAAGGSSNFLCAVARFKTDGTLDSTFSGDGKLTTKINSGDNPATGGLAIQKDGKIVVGGTCFDNVGDPRFQLIRYNTNGTLDKTFGGVGYVITSVGNYLDLAGAIAIQPDGKIIQAGSSKHIYNGTRFLTVMRFNTDGSLDNSFGTNGIVLTVVGDTTNDNFPSGVIIQPDGKILVGGSTLGKKFVGCFSLVRYNINGTLDNSFGAGGIVTTFFGNGGVSGNDYDDDLGNAIALQSDGKIVMTGASYLGIDTLYKIPIIRYKSNGTLDSSFGNLGKVRLTVTKMKGAIAQSIKVQEDGKLIIAGYAGYDSISNPGFLLERYKINGELDSSFGLNGIIITSLGSSFFEAYSMALQKDGKIIVAGYSDNNGMVVVRYLSDLNVGIIDFSLKENSVLIYPNPIKTEAVLQYTLTQDKKLSIVLYDMLGRQVQTFIANETRTQGERKEVLQFSSALSAGNYILSISNGQGSQQVKIVKL